MDDETREYLYRHPDIERTRAMWKKYRKTGLAEMRPYIPEEAMYDISVSDTDILELGGMIARNQDNHADQWYVAKKFFEDNYEEVE